MLLIFAKYMAFFFLETIFKKSWVTFISQFTDLFIIPVAQSERGLSEMSEILEVPIEENGPD